MAMFVYLDESGDTGFRFRHGSSRYFVVTLLLVDDPIPLHSAIDDLRTGLGLAPGNEFKFQKSSNDVRESFLRMMRRQNFAARILVIDKTRITNPSSKTRSSFYSVLVRSVLENDHGTINNAILILDESVQSKQRKQQLSTYLRQSLNTDQNQRKITAVRCHASHTDNLIQAADMISGAVYAKYHQGNTRYYDIIRIKIVHIQEGDISIQ